MRTAQAESDKLVIKTNTRLCVSIQCVLRKQFLYYKICHVERLQSSGYIWGCSSDQFQQQGSTFLDALDRR